MRPIIKEAFKDQSEPDTLPAPIGGWNARDSYARMPQLDAVYLDNWFPRTTTVDVRPGSLTNATLPAAEVIRSLFTVAKADGTTKRFAVSASGIWDITAGGVLVAPPAEVVTNNVWQYTGIEVGGVSYLWACCGDGVNGVRLYNATTGVWLTMTAISVPALTGIDPTLVTNVSLYGTRLILCKKDSLSFYYMPLNSVGGAATEFPLGALFKRGGYLMATETWSVDGGDGLDDRFVAVTSEGEVAIYGGPDPSLATFTKIGVFYIGRPIGRRCLVKMGGELGILTERGLYPLSRSLQFAGTEKRVALTDKIDNAFLTYFDQWGANFGWQPVVLPKAPALFINVPIGSSMSYQFVMNAMTGAWCRFMGWNAEAIVVSAGDLYFAMNNKVWKGWTGGKDDNAAITARFKTAWTYGPRKARTKKVHLVKPVMRTTSAVTIFLALDTDFEDRSGLQSAASFPQNIALWDSALFDTALWSGGNVMLNRWKSVSHSPGKTFALRGLIQVKEIDVKWQATDFLLENGGLL
jgi:hypothetical protein